MCAFGVLGLSCASPGGPVWWGRRCSTRTTREPKRAHLSARSSKTPPKFNEKTFQREKTERNFRWEREKKERNFGRSRGRGVRGRGPKILNTPTTQQTTGTNRHQQAPTGINQEQQTTTKTMTNNNRKFGQNIKTPILAKCGLAKCGQHFGTLILAKCGLAKCGLAKCGHENKLSKFGFFFWPNAVLAKCGLAKCGHDQGRS